MRGGEGGQTQAKKGARLCTPPSPNQCFSAKGHKRIDLFQQQEVPGAGAGVTVAHGNHRAVLKRAVCRCTPEILQVWLRIMTIKQFMQ